MKIDDLKPCDVLLFQGTSPLARLIRLLDHGVYSHAAIYIGQNDKDIPYMAEMHNSGLICRPLNISKIDNIASVDVYRYFDDKGEEALNTSPILKRANYYIKTGEDYAYDEMLLLALLCSTRRIPSGSAEFEQLLDSFLEDGLDIIADFLVKKQKPMICSEFVYRCYAEASPEYLLPVTGAKLASKEAATTLSQAVVLSAKLTFLENYFLTAAQNNVNFVTPNDLARCKNLQKLSILRT